MHVLMGILEQPYRVPLMCMCVRHCTVPGEDLGERDPVTKQLIGDDERLTQLLAATEDDPAAIEIISSLRGRGRIRATARDLFKGTMYPFLCALADADLNDTPALEKNMEKMCQGDATMIGVVFQSTMTRRERLRDWWESIMLSLTPWQRFFIFARLGMVVFWGVAMGVVQL